MTNAAGQPDANQAAVAYGGLRSLFTQRSAGGLTCAISPAVGRQFRS